MDKDNPWKKAKNRRQKNPKNVSYDDFNPSSPFVIEGDNLLDHQLLECPEMRWEKRMEIDSNCSGDFKYLSRAAVTLIENIPSYLRDCMRMELNRTDNELDPSITHWELVIKVSTVFWFDRHLQKIKEVEERLGIALKYLELEREKISNSTNGYVHDGEIEVFQKEHCKNQTNCRHHKQGKCRYSHSTIVCKEKVERRGGSYSRECDWFCCEELCIHKDEHFILMVRPEPFRDLLFLPYPKKTSYWKGHYTNSELISIPYFWESCFKNIQYLSKKMNTSGAHIVQKVALNFGIWETAMSLDHRAIDCHGHAHIELTRDAAIGLSKEIKGLKGRIGDPEDYREKNCNELEMKRLNSIQFKSLRAEIKSINNSINTLQESVNKVLKYIESTK